MELKCLKYFYEVYGNFWGNFNVVANSPFSSSTKSGIIEMIRAAQSAIKEND
jgi:hypothetical protein